MTALSQATSHQGKHHRGAGDKTLEGQSRPTRPLEKAPFGGIEDDELRAGRGGGGGGGGFW